MNTIGTVVALALGVLLVLFYLMRKGPTGGNDSDGDDDGH